MERVDGYPLSELERFVAETSPADARAFLLECIEILAELAARGVRTLVCEGGPRVYGSLLAAGVELDEFLTLSPLVLGDDEIGPKRPSLVEGVRFAPGAAPRSRLLSVRRGGDHLYLRSRYG
jgi:riboflavin biosynthesis pyrimidine reductase